MLTLPCEVTVAIGHWLNYSHDGFFNIEIRLVPGSVVMRRRLLGRAGEELSGVVYEDIASIPEFAFSKHFDNEWARLCRCGVLNRLERECQGQKRPGSVWLDAPASEEVIHRFFNLGSIVYAANGRDYYKWDRADKATTVIQSGGRLLDALNFPNVVRHNLVEQKYDGEYEFQSNKAQ